VILVGLSRKSVALYNLFDMDELVCFICGSQDELEKLAYQTSQLTFHRYFIIVGFEVNRNYHLLKATDSFLEIQSLDKSNLEILKRLSLVYSPPDYENIAFYISNNIISLTELQSLFHDLLNGRHTKTDYLFSISRMNFVFEKQLPEKEAVNPLEYSEIIDDAMMEKPISYDHFKIAIKELLPEYTFTLDQSCMVMNNDLKNILLDHNKKNYIPKLTTYYNEIKEHEKCIMFFNLDPILQNYSSKIISIEGYVVYMRL
jgi:hypothetical protein